MRSGRPVSDQRRRQLPRVRISQHWLLLVVFANESPAAIVVKDQGTCCIPVNSWERDSIVDSSIHVL